jgi:transcription-repair coupling factor (superfamily II helicase)
VSEIFLTDHTIQYFRQHFRTQFGVEALKSSLYENITQGRQVAGQEHWLGLFYEAKITLQNYVPQGVVFCDYQITEVYKAHQDQLKDHYQMRQLQHDSPYYPLLPEALFQSEIQFPKKVQFSPFVEEGAVDMQGKFWAASSKGSQKSPHKDPVDLLQKNPPQIVALHSEGSRDRVQKIFLSRGMEAFANIDTFKVNPKVMGLAILPLSRGFVSPSLSVVTEEDLFGERLVRRSQRKPNKALALELNNFQVGDLLVHEEHGIGKFMGFP